ncbi:hypothetical protein Tco_0163288, partial [Tanacetum coccineum]
EVPNESLPDSTSAQPSEVPFEQQPDPSTSPSPRPSPQPSPTPTIPDSIPEPSDQAKEIKLLKAKITKLKKQAQPVIKHFKAYLKTISLQKRIPKKSSSKKQMMHNKNVSKQGRKIEKGESSVQKEPMFDVMPEDNIDHMEADNAQSEGRTKELVDKDKELDDDRLSTDLEKNKIEGADDQVEGTEEKNEEKEEIFESWQGKFKKNGKRRRRKNQWLKKNPTMKPHLNFDEINARIEAEQNSAGSIKSKDIEHSQLKKELRNFKHFELKSKKFEDIQVMYEKLKRSDEDFIAIGSVTDEKLIKRMNKKDSSKGEEIKQESKEEVKKEENEEVLIYTVAQDEEKKMDYRDS